jgi:putative transposase
MSEKYKTYPGGLFFVTLTVVGWIDVFTRREYADEIIRNLNYCIENKGLKVYAFCIMPSHLHMVAYSENSLSDTLREFKSYTAKKIINLIENNTQESRKEWLLYLFRYYGKYNKHNAEHQFWQQHNHPIDLITAKFIDQKIDYIHDNPVNAGLVTEAHCYVFSSANPDTELKLEVL